MAFLKCFLIFNNLGYNVSYIINQTDLRFKKIKNERKKRALDEWRFAVIKAFFLFAAAALLVRLFVLQIIKHQEYLAAAERQQGVAISKPSKRGLIYTQDKVGNLFTVALNKEWPVVAVAPDKVKNVKRVAEALAENTSVSPEILYKMLAKSNDPFEIVARKIDDAKTEILRNITEKEKLSGIIISQELRRFYPAGSMASAVLGFVGLEKDKEIGQYGLERWYDKELSGEASFFPAVESITEKFVMLGRKIVVPKERGDSLVLTLDHNVQFAVEEELRKVIQKWDAVSGYALILEPSTGKIMAMAAHPAYDLNFYAREKDISVFKNPLVDSQFELGSIMKPITMAAGIEEKVVGSNTTYIDNGEVAIGSFRIKNFDLAAHGEQTMTQVLEKSLNTGAIFVQKLIGKDNFYGYIKKFGFGEKTGVLFPGEVKGDISHLAHKRDSDYATASFGQGVAVTPIQMALAISAIANKGIMMEPYLVEKIIDDSGNEILSKPAVKRNVISKETAETVTAMLVSAVKNGFENRAGVDGYFVAGKTGTAQVPYKNKRGYDPERAIHSFVGYAPAFEPKFLIFLQLNEPKGVRFASASLTPAFQAIAKYMLNYYEIPRDYESNAKTSFAPKNL